MISIDDKKEILTIADDVVAGDLSIDYALIHIEEVLSNYVNLDRL